MGKEITLSTGVVLRCTMVSMYLIGELTKNLKPPKPPKVYVESLKVYEENPEDPGYLAELQSYNLELSTRYVDGVIVFGTELVSSPKTIEAITSDDWVEKAQVIGITVDTKSKHSRYLGWIKFVAAPSTADIELISATVGRLSGVSEEDVDKAGEQFRGNS